MVGIKNPLNIAQWAALGIMVGTAVFQQAMIVPSLTLCLALNQINRQRFERIQANQHQANHPLRSEIKSLEDRCETVEKVLLQLKLQSQNQLSKEDFTPIIPEIQQLQQGKMLLRQSIAQMEGGLAESQQKLSDLHHWISDLDASLEALHDRTRNFDEVREQVVVWQQLLLTYPQYDRGRVVLFVDGPALDRAAQKLGIKIDYIKMRSFLVGDSPLFRSYFYARVKAANKQQQVFLNDLRLHDYRVVSKNDLIKTTMDVEIAIDLLSLAGAYDTAVVITGSDDLAPALASISSRGIRVEIVNLKSGGKSETLRECSDKYMTLESIQSKICKFSTTVFISRQSIAA